MNGLSLYRYEDMMSTRRSSGTTNLASHRTLRARRWKFLIIIAFIGTFGNASRHRLMWTIATDRRYQEGAKENNVPFFVFAKRSHGTITWYALISAPNMTVTASYTVKYGAVNTSTAMVIDRNWGISCPSPGFTLAVS